MVAKVPLPRSGYLDSHGVLHESLAEYLVAEVRERYALGKISDEELPVCVEAALRGDFETATGSPFRPVRMEQRAA